MNPAARAATILLAMTAGALVLTSPAAADTSAMTAGSMHTFTLCSGATDAPVLQLRVAGTWTPAAQAGFYRTSDCAPARYATAVRLRLPREAGVYTYRILARGHVRETGAFTVTP